jgi:hypothetical protein
LRLAAFLHFAHAGMAAISVQNGRLIGASNNVLEIFSC